MTLLVFSKIYIFKVKSVLKPQNKHKVKQKVAWQTQERCLTIPKKCLTIPNKIPDNRQLCFLGSFLKTKKSRLTNGCTGCQASFLGPSGTFFPGGHKYNSAKDKKYRECNQITIYHSYSVVLSEPGPEGPEALSPGHLFWDGPTYFLGL